MGIDSKAATVPVALRVRLTKSTSTLPTVTLRAVPESQ
ncbi:hypothetical protein CWATWH0401_2718 [Crocosphaera watsonii WH 0401]|uniref:Uncharacterized protein n=1 Tax=Crocosphaera watsonii WH 0401 TaxID=555881 RepID=T2J8W5_CROWT|nr:hypothetical protein CWATWH0401_2718 [Crocosphaera watsonii WH 0401]